MACAAKLQCTGVAVDCFTPEFKRLKAKKPPPNFENVIDLHICQETSGSSSNENFQVCLRESSRFSLKCIAVN